MKGWKKSFNYENRHFETENGILYCGDCLEIMKNFPEDTIDLVVTSPPYDSLRSYKNNIDEIWCFDVFKNIAKELTRVLKNGGVIVWVVGDATIKGSETGSSFKQALYFKEKCGLNIHDTMIYAKNGFSKPSHNRYHQVFEYMFIFSKGKPKTFNPIKDKKNKYAGQTSWGRNTIRTKDGKLVEKKRRIMSEYGMRYNIWKYNVGKGFSQKDDIAFQHPATFPEQLAYDHIISWSNENDLVFDPFMGSGTVAKQCEILNRRWLGSDISYEYCDITKNRLSNIQKSLNL
jgi:site-specific DNA-methyltransferase (adenine-specific)